MSNLPRTKCTGANQVSLAKRVVGKTPLSQVQSRDRDELASPSSSHAFVERQGVGETVQDWSRSLAACTITPTSTDNQLVGSCKFSQTHLLGAIGRY